MLKFRDVFYEEYEQALSPEERAEIMNAIPCDFQGQTFTEFLYLNGDKLGWTWARME
jgi:hypothetical protein